ncbi:DUF6961 family protein [Sphingobium chungbukense]|uniref:Uncharacterized protein n=1 Tax=Sphingobium chungbukense TaxID=56193 RepID=A0A0M3APY1_9SPHN|nr:hypothetical protein [Sphingobium chungbukense]KKW92232.1 hypothetical protein YP76_09850 [Sphingobium chungbukense]
MPLDDWELWACAQQVIKQYGAKAPVHVAGRIGELATAGDLDGVQAWQAIAERVEQLMDYRTGRPLSKQ